MRTRSTPSWKAVARVRPPTGPSRAVFPRTIRARARRPVRSAVRCRRPDPACRDRTERPESALAFFIAGIPMFDLTPRLDCAGRELVLDRPRVMGIVNVTPDSFSDGGRHDTIEAAVAHGLRLAAEGGDVLDVGGESTRPGADEVTVEEELRRVIPVIERLVR